MAQRHRLTGFQGLMTGGADSKGGLIPNQVWLSKQADQVAKTARSDPMFHRRIIMPFEN